MVKNKNEMWKLDLLESKFQNTSPRFPHTKKLLVAKHNTKLMKKLPATPEEANLQINSLKSEIFHMKYHAASKKLEKEISRLLKQKSTDLEFFKSEDNVQLLITSKLIRGITSTVLLSKDLKTNPPSYIMTEIRNIITDSNNPSNPSCFFKTFCQNNKELNNFISNLWNNKAVKSCLNEIEWSFRMVRGNLTKQEREARKKVTGKASEHDGEKPESGEESDEESDEDSEEDSEDNDEEQEEDIDLEKEYDKFAVYDKLVGDSDDEGEEKFEADPNVNYNEVTDEEPSESESQDESEDDFFEHSEEEKDNKYNLPELATGYYSGGSDDESDDDVDNDKVVKELTTQRKNRRGQRARQKIWAKKYGQNAKHVKLQQEQYANERQKRQLEYEERERKRQLKKQLAEQPTGANTAPLGERKAGTSSAPAEPKAVHPSWEAKKKQEEMLKIKFQGKKITFD